MSASITTWSSLLRNDMALTSSTQSTLGKYHPTTVLGWIIASKWNLVNRLTVWETIVHTHTHTYWCVCFKNSVTWTTLSYVTFLAFKVHFEGVLTAISSSSSNRVKTGRLLHREEILLVFLVSWITTYRILCWLLVQFLLIQKTKIKKQKSTKRSF